MCCDLGAEADVGRRSGQSLPGRGDWMCVHVRGAEVAVPDVLTWHEGDQSSRPLSFPRGGSAKLSLSHPLPAHSASSSKVSDLGVLGTVTSGGAGGAGLHSHALTRTHTHMCT